MAILEPKRLTLEAKRGIISDVDFREGTVEYAGPIAKLEFGRI